MLLEKLETVQIKGKNESSLSTQVPKNGSGCCPHPPRRLWARTQRYTQKEVLTSILKLEPYTRVLKCAPQLVHFMATPPSQSKTTDFVFNRLGTQLLFLYQLA